MAEKAGVDDHQALRLTWMIENFSRSSVKMVYSDIFTVGGYVWRVLIYPKGNDVDYFSLYLDVADSGNLEYGWSRYARFSLAVINQRDSQLTIRKDTQHDFKSGESDWGFKSFMALSDLNDLSKGYIVKDKVIVEAVVAGRVGLRNPRATCYMNSVLEVAVTEHEGTHASTRGEAAVKPNRAQALVMESQQVSPVVTVGEQTDRTKVESAGAQIPPGGDGTQPSVRTSTDLSQPKETVSVPDKTATSIELSQPQEPKDKQVVESEMVKPVGGSAEKEGGAAAKVETAIEKAQDSPTASGVTTVVGAIKPSFSIQEISEVLVPEEVPYEGPGHGLDLVEWLTFRVQRTSVTYLNKLVERYPDSLAQFSSRSSLVQAGHLSTLALLLYTADTIPVRAWSSTLQERLLSYIEDLKEARVELPWLMDRFAMLDSFRARYLAKADLEELEPEANKLKLEITQLQAKLGTVEEKIAVAQATFEAKENSLSGLNSTIAPDNSILSGLL